MKALVAPIALIAAVAAVRAETKPATRPAEVKTYTSWQQMYREVPADMRPADASKLSDLQIEAINSELKERVVNQRATLRLKAHQVEITKGGRYDGLPRILTDYDKAGGVKTAIVLYFANTEESKRLLAKVSKGDVISGSGDIAEVGFDRADSLPAVHGPGYEFHD
jgi:hypothetical protein